MQIMRQWRRRGGYGKEEKSDDKDEDQDIMTRMIKEEDEK